MPRSRLSMRHIREVLRLRWELGLSVRATARGCGLTHPTVLKYVQRAGQPFWRRSTKIAKLRQPQSCTPQFRRLIPVAMMISSRAGRSFSTAFSEATAGRGLRRPFGLAPLESTGTMLPSAWDRYR